jgi:site-specific recombinase XerD
MHRLAQGADIRTVQGLHEHSDVKTTRVVTPELNRDPSGAQRPADLF